jgi:hypothetical protein
LGDDLVEEFDGDCGERGGHTTRGWERGHFHFEHIDDRRATWTKSWQCSAILYL